MATSEILHVGIDLGTSRSAISASNGERFVVDSFVGWPADMVAKKILKRNVLIGHEAVANRTMLDLHRPLERGLLIITCGVYGNCIRVLVPLVIADSELEEALEAWEEALEAVLG